MGLAIIVVLPASAARASLVSELNELRAQGCEGKRGISAPLRAQPRLDEAARRLSRGTRLRDALEDANYRALQSSSLQLSNPGSDAEIARALARRSCDQLLDTNVREIGVARRGKTIWIVLAAPFTAPALQDAVAVSRRVLALANEARERPRRCGTSFLGSASPLALSQGLSNAALAHSRDMAEHNRMSHEGSDGSTPAQRVTRARYKWRIVGENIAAGPTTPEEVMKGWLASPGHCQNLMDPRFTELGVGFVLHPQSESGVYWTQVFAAPARP